MSGYAWIIDKDLIELDDEGTTGPRAATGEALAKLRAGEGTKFRMRDDDDTIYYEGRLVGGWETNDGFGPLDDFGMPNAGCTSIEYWNENKWEIL